MSLDLKSSVLSLNYREHGQIESSQDVTNLGIGMKINVSRVLSYYGDQSGDRN